MTLKLQEELEEIRRRLADLKVDVATLDMPMFKRVIVGGAHYASLRKHLQDAYFELQQMRKFIEQWEAK